MRFSIDQKVFLTAGVGFFSLHFLFHFVGVEMTGLLHQLLTVLAIPAIVLIVLALAIRWRWAKSDASRSNRARWVLTFAFMLVAGLGARLCNSTYCHGLPATHLQRSFDRDVWGRDVSYSGCKVTERQMMLGSVIRTVVVGGKRDEVLELLGKPDASTGIVRGNGDRKFYYYIGCTQDSFGIPDTEVFVICFNENGDVDNWYTERE